MSKRKRNRAARYDSSPKFTSTEDVVEERKSTFFRRVRKKFSKLDGIGEPVLDILNAVLKGLT